MNRLNNWFKNKYLGKDRLSFDLLIERLKKLYREPNNIQKQFPEVVILRHLDDFFWDEGGIKNKDNKTIYPEALLAFKQAEKNGHITETMKKDLHFQKGKNKEFFNRCIKKEILFPDQSEPPNYLLNIEEKTVLMTTTDLITKPIKFIIDLVKSLK